ncbi:hypothetical protein SERLADRAFT_438382 [Serpula lacrymans var. lacrymans S7.9]|uniref:Uncharacterized protein n=1 Tax=Serpula lacrymans var. lacrymans (strain S7.9) TaxID=578457 RepID=F8NXW4_SERL9|nr:uncharacterized protein SERLADRAFT_438382 [Serpula lacrymans var. lacrymans S7.9]EGO24780.1 hypothetical protein SERLADRAFT_438382 [Serpula lacrymans var. lacrymans S7.9]
METSKGKEIVCSPGSEFDSKDSDDEGWQPATVNKKSRKKLLSLIASVSEIKLREVLADLVLIAFGSSILCATDSDSEPDTEDIEGVSGARLREILATWVDKNKVVEEALMCELVVEKRTEVCEVLSRFETCKNCNWIYAQAFQRDTIFEERHSGWTGSPEIPVDVLL